MREIQTVCGMCGIDNCGITVRLDGERIVSLRGTPENPLNRGKLCPQARASVELTNDPNRLQYPLRREGDSWRRISWDEALDTIAERLTALKQSEGAQAFAAWEGRGILRFSLMGWARRFLSLYGSPNLVTNDHMCSIPTDIAEQLTYGATTIGTFDPERTRCLLFWGCNPAASYVPTLWRALTEARQRGTVVLAVDPRRSQTAALAAVHAAPRPGTDLALALSLIHVIIAEALYDAAFVAQWTAGFEELAASVEGYTPGWAAAVTGVPEEDIRRLAHTYATTRPAYLHAGNALEHHTNSAQTLRALMILRAITGNLDVPGGHVFPERLPLADITLQDRALPGLRPLGADRYPLFAQYARRATGDAVVDSLLSGRPYPLRAAILAGANPLLTWPNTSRVQAALARLEFFVVMDLYMTPTARMANIVLPAASTFEKTELVARTGHFPDNPPWFITLKRRFIDPGERRSEWWLWRQLAERVGYGKDYPWATVEEAIDFQLAPLGFSVKDLEESPSGVYWGGRQRYRKYESKGLPTLSGQVELRSQVMEAAGYEAVPSYCEPIESPVSAPELAERYPLVLTAGRRLTVYTHSRHRNLPSLRQQEPEPWAELHPETAAEYGISDGDWVSVETLRGSITLRAQLTVRMRRGVVGITHGWEEANANLLTACSPCDPVLGCPPIRSSLCRIRKREE